MQVPQLYRPKAPNGHGAILYSYNLILLRQFYKDSLSQPAADSSLGEGALRGCVRRRDKPKPPSPREVARERRRESCRDKLISCKCRSCTAPKPPKGYGVGLYSYNHILLRWYYKDSLSQLR